MNTTTYVVSGFITTNDKEDNIRRTLYAGNDGSKAMDFLTWGEQADINIDLWVDGKVIHTITK